MTSSFPGSTWPNVCAGSSARRLTRIQSTSIGAPRSTSGSSARARTTEWRPSAPTVRSARTSNGPRRPLARTPTTRPLLDGEVGDLGFHLDSKGRVGLRLLDEEAQEIPLGHERDELAVRRQIREVRDHPRRRRRSGPPISVIFWCGRARSSSRIPSSCMTSSVEGWMVSPRKSRRKSACFSSTRTSTPARARRSPSMTPAGPPPTMHERAVRAGVSVVVVVVEPPLREGLLSIRARVAARRLQARARQARRRLRDAPWHPLARPDLFQTSREGPVGKPRAPTIACGAGRTEVLHRFPQRAGRITQR